MNATELQIQIDDILSCLGCCSGCALSEKERLQEGSALSGQAFDQAFEKLTAYAGMLEGLSSVNVTFGIADHLLVPPAHTGDIYRRAAYLIKNSPARQGAVFFSTSLVGKADEVKAKLAEIRAYVDEVPLYPVVVIDPDKASLVNYGKIYAANIEYARDVFGRIDLALNLSNAAVARMSPQELADFARQYGYEEVTINWTPTPGNILRTAADIEAIGNWLVGFAEAAEQGGFRYSFGDVIRRAIEAARFANEEDLPLHEYAPDILVETARRSIQIDANGDVSVKLEAVGDIAHSERFGFKAIGHVSEKRAIAEMLSDAEAQMSSYVISGHVGTPACSDCEFVRACAATGFHAYNHVLKRSGAIKKDSSGCPHMAKRLFEYFAKAF